MEFKSYTGQETLEADGFQVFDSAEIKAIIESFNTDLEEVSKEYPSTDVFRTKLGDVKQIQNIHKHFPEQVEKLNKKLAELIEASTYTVLNNQYFAKPPNYKMTSAHQDNAYFESGENVYTFWIPLQDVDILNSCMFYVPGSHKQGLIEHKAIGTNVRTRTGKTGYSLYSDYYKNKVWQSNP